MSTSNRIEPPFALLAELTHRCPLRCLYCSNPKSLVASSGEMDQHVWCDLIEQAAELGVLQVHLSGGEPLARSDLEVMVAKCSELGLYSNLVTSGIGLDESRLSALVAAGLSSVQMSFQSADAELSERIAGVDVLSQKKKAASSLSANGIPLTLNCVLHRVNIDRLDEIVALCIGYGASRVELANCQYYGWALANRASLLPTRTQVESARAKYLTLARELAGRVELVWVIADYYSDYPKPCMGGWGKRQLTVSPDGRVLPCPAAYSIESLEFPTVVDDSLSNIWFRSMAFNAFRGEAWMPEPCRSCERKTEDFGGCRCQAFALTGDAAATDPVCSRSPHRSMVDEIISAGETSRSLVYRSAPKSSKKP